MARDYYDETKEASAKQKQADAQATVELNKQPVYQPKLANQPDIQDYEIQAGIKQYPSNTGVAEDTVEQIRNDRIAAGERKATSTPNKIITPTNDVQGNNTVPSQAQQAQQAQSQQAPGEVIPATLKSQADWNAVGKYMYLPNHPKAVNGYVQLSRGDVIWARQKLNLPTEQPEATAPVTQAAQQTTTTAAQPKDAVDKQAVGVPLDQRGELLKQYQKAMRNAKKLKAQYISKAKQYFKDIEQIKADTEGNKEYRMNEARMRWSDEKHALNGEYQKAMQVASQYYEQLRK